MRSHRSDTRRTGTADRSYEERYVHDRYAEDKSSARERPRGYSPSGSEFSYRSKSPGRHHSRSTSPVAVPKDHKAKDKHYSVSRAYSPSTPTRDDYDYGSHEEYSTSKRDSRSGSKWDVDKYSDIEERSGKLSSKISRTFSLEGDKLTRPRHSKEDLTDTLDTLSRSHSHTDKVRKQISEEYFDGKDKLDTFAYLREKHQRSQSTSSAGSRNRHKDTEAKDYTGRTDKYGRSPGRRDDAFVGSKVVKVKKRREHSPGSVSSSSSTESSESEGEAEASSGTASHSSGDVSQLEQKKMDLLKELKMLPQSGSESEEGALPDDDNEDNGRKSKKPRLEDIFDLGDKAMSLKNLRGAAKIMELHKAAAGVEGAALLLDKHRPLDTSKFRPIDSSQSLRKQMEAMHQKGKEHGMSSSMDTLPLSSKRDSKLFSPSGRMAMDEDMFDISDKSPSEIPSEFIPKKRRRVEQTCGSTDLSHTKVRRYRNRDPGSSGDEGEDSRILRPFHRDPLGLEPVESSRTVVIKSKESRADFQGYMGDTTSDYRHKHAGATASHDDKKADPRLFRRESKEFKEPPIIPDSPIEVMEGKDKRIPQEPRTIRENGRKEARDLPLPRFARDFKCGLVSPKEHVTPLSPKAPDVPEEQSPPRLVSPPPVLGKPNLSPFSPVTTSPQVSPIIPKPENKMDTLPAAKDNATTPRPVSPPGPGTVALPSVVSIPAVTSAEPVAIGTVQEPSTVINNVHQVDMSPAPLEQSAPLVTETPDNTNKLSNGDKPLDTCGVNGGQGSPAGPGSLAASDTTVQPLDVSNNMGAEAVDLLSPTGQEVSAPVIPNPANTDSTPPPPQAEKDSKAAESTDPAKIELYGNDSDKPSDKPELATTAKVKEKLESSSELSDLCSPTSPEKLSLEERIRALDEKLSLTQNIKPPASLTQQTTSVTSDGSSPTSSSLSDYRDRYKIKKRVDADRTARTGSSPLLSDPKSDPSEMVKNLLNRSTIFEQDIRRLQSNFKEKYEPSNQGNLNLKDAPPHPQSMMVGLNRPNNTGSDSVLTPGQGTGSLAGVGSQLVRQTSAPESNLPYSAQVPAMVPTPNSAPANGNPIPGQSFPFSAAQSTTATNHGYSYGSSSHSPRHSPGSSSGSTPSTPNTGRVDPRVGGAAYMGRRTSLDQKPSPATSPGASQPQTPPLSMNYPGPTTTSTPKDATQQPCLSPVSAPASVLMPPPPPLKLACSSFGEPSADGARKGLTSASANREYPDPPVLKQETKDPLLESPPPTTTYPQGILKRKADDAFSPELTPAAPVLCKSEDSVEETMPKIEPSVTKTTVPEPDMKKTKLSSSSTASTSSGGSDRKKAESSKSHSSKDSKKHSSSSKNSSKTKESPKKEHGHSSSSSKHSDKSKTHSSSKSSSSSHKSESNKNSQHKKDADCHGEKSKESSKTSTSSSDKLTKPSHKSTSSKQGDKDSSKSSDKASKSVEKSGDRSGKVKDGKHKEKDRTKSEDGKTTKSNTSDKHKNEKHKEKSSKSDGKEGERSDKPDKCTDKKPDKDDKGGPDAGAGATGGSCGKKTDASSCYSSGSGSSMQGQQQSKSDKSGSEKQQKSDKEKSSQKQEKTKSSSDSSSKPRPPSSSTKLSSDKKSGQKSDKSKEGRTGTSTSSSKKHEAGEKSEKTSSSSSKGDKNKDGREKTAKARDPVSEKSSKSSSKTKFSPEKTKAEDKESPKAASRKREKSESMESREVKLLLQDHYGDEDNLPGQYVSMYDMVKRRSNKEREKEDMTKKRDELFSHFKDSRRRRSKHSFSEDNSCRDTDDSSGSYTEPKKKSTPKPKDHSKTQAKAKKHIIESDSFSSSSEEDIKPKASAPPKLTKPKPKVTQERAKPWRYADDSTSDSESSDTDSSFNMKSFSRVPNKSKKPSPKPATKQPKPKPKKSPPILSDSDKDTRPKPSTPKVTPKPKKTFSIESESEKDSDVAKALVKSLKPNKMANQSKSSNAVRKGHGIYTSSSSDSETEEDSDYMGYMHPSRFEQSKPKETKSPKAKVLPMKKDLYSVTSTEDELPSVKPPGTPKTKKTKPPGKSSSKIVDISAKKKLKGRPKKVENDIFKDYLFESSEEDETFKLLQEKTKEKLNKKDEKPKKIIKESTPGSLTGSSIIKDHKSFKPKKEKKDKEKKNKAQKELQIKQKVVGADGKTSTGPMKDTAAAGMPLLGSERNKQLQEIGLQSGIQKAISSPAVSKVSDVKGKSEAAQRKRQEAAIDHTKMQSKSSEQVTSKKPSVDEPSPRSDNIFERMEMKDMKKHKKKDNTIKHDKKHKEEKIPMSSQPPKTPKAGLKSPERKGGSAEKVKKDGAIAGANRPKIEEDDINDEERLERQTASAVASIQNLTSVIETAIPDNSAITEVTVPDAVSTEVELTEEVKEVQDPGAPTQAAIEEAEAATKALLELGFVTDVPESSVETEEIPVQEMAIEEVIQEEEIIETEVEVKTETTSLRKEDHLPNSAILGKDKPDKFAMFSSAESNLEDEDDDEASLKIDLDSEDNITIDTEKKKSTENKHPDERKAESKKRGRKQKVNESPEPEPGPFALSRYLPPVMSKPEVPQKKGTPAKAKTPEHKLNTSWDPKSGGSDNNRSGSDTGESGGSRGRGKRGRGGSRGRGRGKKLEDRLDIFDNTCISKKSGLVEEALSGILGHNMPAYGDKGVRMPCFATKASRKQMDSYGFIGSDSEGKKDMMSHQKPPFGHFPEPGMPPLDIGQKDEKVVDGQAQTFKEQLSNFKNMSKTEKVLAFKENAVHNKKEAGDKSLLAELDAIREQAQKAIPAKDQEMKEVVLQELALKEQAERESAAREQLKVEEAARELERKEQAMKEQVEQERLTKEQAEREKAEKEQAMREQAAKEQAERERLMKEQAVREQALKEQEERERAIREQAAREQARKEQAERERLLKEHAAREQAKREQAERERVMKEQAAKEAMREREKAMKEQAMREQAAREQAMMKEQAAREMAMKEQAAREQQAMKEEAMRELARKEQAAREHAIQEHYVREQARNHYARELAREQAMREMTKEKTGREKKKEKVGVMEEQFIRESEIQLRKQMQEQLPKMPFHPSEPGHGPPAHNSQDPGHVAEKLKSERKSGQGDTGKETKEQEERSHALASPRPQDPHLAWPPNAPRLPLPPGFWPPPNQQQLMRGPFPADLQGPWPAGVPLPPADLRPQLSPGAPGFPPDQRNPLPWPLPGQWPLHPGMPMPGQHPWMIPPHQRMPLPPQEIVSQPTPKTPTSSHSPQTSLAPSQKSKDKGVISVIEPPQEKDIPGTVHKEPDAPTSFSSGKEGTALTSPDHLATGIPVTKSEDFDKKEARPRKVKLNRGRRSRDKSGEKEKLPDGDLKDPLPFSIPNGPTEVPVHLESKPAASLETQQEPAQIAPVTEPERQLLQDVIKEEEQQQQKKEEVGVPLKSEEQELDPGNKDKPTTPTKANQKQAVIPNYELPTLRKREPSTPNSASSSNSDSMEKFSSRGRKIIPKEREDEVTGMVRKTRRQLLGKEEAEGKGRGRKNTTGETLEGENQMPRTPKRGRRVSPRGNRDDGQPELMHSEQAGETEEEGEAKVPTDSLNEQPLTPRRRRSQRRVTKEDGEGKTECHEVEEQETDANTSREEGAMGVAVLSGSEESPRARRGRKPKNKRVSSDQIGSLPSPRAGSPRAEGAYGTATSPKSSELINKPFVKLEKLAMIEDTLKKEDGKGRDDGLPDSGQGRYFHGDEELRGEPPKQAKDLYDFKDEEDQPLPGYTQMRNRKRPASESTGESPKKGSPEKSQETAEPESKRSKEDPVQPKPKEASKPVTQETPDNRTSTHPPPAPPKPLENLTVASTCPPLVEENEGPPETMVETIPMSQSVVHPAPRATPPPPAAEKSKPNLGAQGASQPEIHTPLSSRPLAPSFVENAQEAREMPRHLPLKLKMKKDAADAAAREAAREAEEREREKEREELRAIEAQARAMKDSPEPMSASCTPPLPTSSVVTCTSWKTNIDKVIDEVSKGNFDRGDEFDFYQSKKKPRSKHRDEHLSPGQQGLGMMGQVPMVPVTIDTSTGVPHPPVGLLSPISVSLPMAMPSPGLGPPHPAHSLPPGDKHTSKLRSPPVSTSQMKSPPPHGAQAPILPGGPGVQGKNVLPLT